MSSNTYQLVTLWQWTYFKHVLPLNRFNSSTGFGAKKNLREGDRKGEKNLVIVVLETRARKVGNLIDQTRSSSGSIGSSCTSGSAVAVVCTFSRVLVIFWVLADLRNNKTGSPWEATNWLFVCWGAAAAAAAAAAAFWSKKWQKILLKKIIPFLFAFLASG